MTTISVQHDINEPPFPHQFRTAIEACRFLNSLLSYPIGQSTISIRAQPTTRYRVVCHATSGSDRWLRVMRDGTIRTCRDQVDATVLGSREEAYRYCDQANRLQTIDYAAPQGV